MTETISAVIAIIAAPLGAFLSAVFLRSKYKAEIMSLRADIDKKLTEVQRNELENVRSGNNILMEQIVTPLKAELKLLRANVNKFTKAIEKITTCPLSATCPVRSELYSDEKSTGEHSGADKGDS